MKGSPVISAAFLSLCLFLSVGLASCQKDDRRELDSRLSDEQQEEYRNAISQISRVAGFEVLYPSYIPNETSWLPDTDYVRRSEEATLVFYPVSPEGASSAGPRIDIAERRDPLGQACPPCDEGDDSRFEPGKIREIPVLLREGRSGSSAVFLTVYLRVGDIRVVARFDWELPEHVPVVVNDEMRAEARKVIESML